MNNQNANSQVKLKYVDICLPPLSLTITKRWRRRKKKGKETRSEGSFSAGQEENSFVINVLSNSVIFSLRRRTARSSKAHRDVWLFCLRPNICCRMFRRPSVLLLFFLLSVNFRFLLSNRRGYATGRESERNANSSNRKRISKNLSTRSKKLTSVPGTILLVHVTSCDVNSESEVKSSIFTVPIKLRFVGRPKS